MPKYPWIWSTAEHQALRKVEKRSARGSPKEAEPPTRHDGVPGGLGDAPGGDRQAAGVLSHHGLAHHALTRIPGEGGRVSAGDLCGDAGPPFAVGG